MEGTESVSVAAALVSVVKFVTKLCDHSVQQQQSSQDHLYQNKATFRLLPTLVVSIGILVLLSVGSVLIVNWIADRHIVREYTSRLIARGLSAEERSLREHLDAAVNQGDFIAAAIGSGRFQFGEPALADFLSGTLAAAPQVYGLIVSDPNGKALHLLRGAAATELRSTISTLRRIASSPRSRIRFARTNTRIGERRFIARHGRRPF